MSQINSKVTFGTIFFFEHATCRSHSAPHRFGCSEIIAVRASASVETIGGGIGEEIEARREEKVSKNRTNKNKFYSIQFSPLRFHSVSAIGE